MNNTQTKKLKLYRFHNFGFFAKNHIDTTPDMVYAKY